MDGMEGMEEGDSWKKTWSKKSCDTAPLTYFLVFWQAYNQIDVYFQFKTLETEGLILYNAGKEDDFLAIELVAGHIQYTFNMG